HVNVKIANRFDKPPAKRDLLLGLAQRGRGWAFVTGINLSAGKRNLSPVIRKMCCALSEQHARLVAFYDRHQHRGRPDRPYRSEGGDYSGIGVLLIVLRDDMRIGKA